MSALSLLQTETSAHEAKFAQMFKVYFADRDELYGAPNPRKEVLPILFDRTWQESSTLPANSFRDIFYIILNNTVLNYSLHIWFPLFIDAFLYQACELSRSASTLEPILTKS